MLREFSIIFPEISSDEIVRTRLCALTVTGSVPSFLITAYFTTAPLIDSASFHTSPFAEYTNESPFAFKALAVSERAKFAPITALGRAIPTY